MSAFMKIDTFIPQSAILTPFLTAMPAISLCIIDPEKRENFSNVLITSVADYSFLRTT